MTPMKIIRNYFLLIDDEKFNFKKIGLLIQTNAYLFKSLNSKHKGPILDIIYQKIENADTNNKIIFIILLLEFSNKNINYQYIFQKLSDEDINDNNIYFMYSCLRIMNEVYGINIRFIQELWLIKYINTNFETGMKKNDNKIVIIIKNFPIHIHHGAHASLADSFIRSISYNRKEKVKLFLINDDTTVDIYSDYNLRETEMPVSFDTLIKNDKYYNDVQIETIDKINLRHLYNEVFEEYEHSYFIGGFLDCTNERILLHKMNIKVHLILFHENNLLNEYIDTVICSQETRNTSANVVKFNYPVHPNIIDIYKYDKRAFNKSFLNIVTVLSGGRIENALSKLKEEYKNCIFNILDSYPVNWYLIGVNDEKFINEFFENRSNIHIKKEEVNLVDLYHNMDIYFQIPGSEGGGTSMLQSAVCGLPLVAMKEGAARAYVSDELLCPTYSCAISRLNSLIKNKKERENMSKRLINYVKNQLSIEKVADNIRNIELKSMSSS